MICDFSEKLNRFHPSLTLTARPNLCRAPGTRWRDDITPVSASLHWLPVCLRTGHGILPFVFQIGGLVPPSITDLLQVSEVCWSAAPRHETWLKNRGKHVCSVWTPTMLELPPPWKLSHCVLNLIFTPWLFIQVENYEVWRVCLLISTLGLCVLIYFILFLYIYSFICFMYSAALWWSHCL